MIVIFTCLKWLLDSAHFYKAVEQERGHILGNRMGGITGALLIGPVVAGHESRSLYLPCFLDQL